MAELDATVVVVFPVFVGLLEEQEANGQAADDYCGADKVREQVGEGLENGGLEDGGQGECGAGENAAERSAHDGATKERSALGASRGRRGGEDIPKTPDGGHDGIGARWEAELAEAAAAKQ